MFEELIAKGVKITIYDNVFLNTSRQEAHPREPIEDWGVEEQLR